MRALAIPLLAIIALAIPHPAGAAFPGANGAIAVSHGVEGVFGVATVAPEGGAPQRLIATAEAPAYSPDGRWIAYSVPPGPTAAAGCASPAPTAPTGAC